MFNDLVGVKFSNRGRGPYSYDCWGLAIEVRRRLGLKSPDFDISAFAFTVIGNEVDDQIANGGWKELGVPSIGSVVAIKNHPKFINHVGVFIGGGKFIHTLEKVNCCIERIGNPMWVKRIKGYYERS